MEHHLFIIQSRQSFVEFSCFCLFTHVIQGEGLVEIMFRPWLFRLSWWVEFFTGGTVPPEFRFRGFPRELEFTRCRHVLSGLRLHSRSAHAKVTRIFNSSCKLASGF